VDWSGVVLLGFTFEEPWPLTVIRSSTLRLPANDCAMRFAVCFSLPVATLPDNATVESVTLTMTFELASVGSFFKAASICVCRLLESALALAPVSPCGSPELCGRADPELSVPVLAVPPAVVPELEVEPVLPTPVEGVVELVELLPCELPLMLPAVLLLSVEVLAPALVPADGLVAAGGVLLGVELVEPATLPVLDPEAGAVELVEPDCGIELPLAELL
jgi:hypothetical protein